MVTRVIIDQGWIEIDDTGLGNCKIARLDPSGSLLFHDRSPCREAARGCDQATVPVVDFIVEVVRAVDDPAKVMTGVLKALAPPYSAR